MLRRWIHRYRQRRRLLSRPIADTRFVVIDTETTGLHAYAGDRIVSIALLEMHGLMLTERRFQSLVNPERDIPATATAIHGIDLEQVQTAPRFPEIARTVRDFIGDAPLVGHHVGFDARFLNLAFRAGDMEPLDNPLLDTMLLFQAWRGQLGHYELEVVARHCRVQAGKRHEALGDALTAARIFSYLTGHLARPQEPLSALMACLRA